MWQKQYGFLRLANFVAGGDCATIQNTAQLAKLANGSFEVNDPLGWEVLDTLKLLACCENMTSVRRCPTSVVR